MGAYKDIFVNEHLDCPISRIFVRCTSNFARCTPCDVLAAPAPHPLHVLQDQTPYRILQLVP